MNEKILNYLNGGNFEFDILTFSSIDSSIVNMIKKANFSLVRIVFLFVIFIIILSFIAFVISLFQKELELKSIIPIAYQVHHNVDKV